jgi:ribosomal 50S subunit-associated protein YjgA (DUF615 family)
MGTGRTDNSTTETGTAEKEREQHKRQQLTDRLRSLTAEQLAALGIDPSLLD